MTNAICYHCTQTVVGDSASGVEVCEFHAAALDLFVACKQLIELNDVHESGCDHLREIRPYPCNCLAPEVISKARAVVAKVEGRDA